jgi:hypothetical protein
MHQNRISVFVNAVNGHAAFEQSLNLVVSDDGLW